MLSSLCPQTPEDEDETSPPPPPPASYCKDFQCPAGYHIMDGVDYVECFAEECEKDECCAKGEASHDGAGVAGVIS